MRIVSTSYCKTEEFDKPEKWLEKISFYSGILDELARNHQVFSIERINYEGEFYQNNVHYFFIRLKKQKVYFPFRMHRLIKELKPDVVLVNGFIFPLQIIQLRLKLGNKVKIIVLHRAEQPYKGFRKYFQWLADKCVDHYFFISSEFGEKWIQHGIISNSNKIKEVVQASSSFQAIDKTKARESLSIAAGPVFLWVGRLDANKDPLTVVRAFTRFLSVEPSARLYMIFHEEKILPQVSNMIAADSKCREAISLVGKVPHQQLPQWYSSADYFISGSHYEGSGVAAIEAISCGCIPVLTNIISFRKITGAGKCGLLFEAGDEKSLLEALLQTQQFDFESERKKALHRFQNEFSFEAIARKVNDVICISTAQPAMEYAKV